MEQGEKYTQLADFTSSFWGQRPLTIPKKPKITNTAQAKEAKMSGEFDVFDEWGSYVGKFTPAGGGWDGCLFAIAMLFLWTVGFLVYLLVKLVVQGFRAAGRKEWDKAAAYWAVPGLIVVWYVLGLASTAATQAAEQAREVARQSELAGAILNPEDAIGFERLRGGLPGSTFPDCPYCDDNFTYGEYRLTNKLVLNEVFVDNSLGGEYGLCEWELGMLISTRVAPGRAITFYCFETASYSLSEKGCVRVEPAWSSDSRLIAEFCLDDKTGVVRPTK